MRFKPFLLFVIGVLLAPMTLHSQTFTLGSGQLTVKHVARNAVRIQYRETLEGQRSKVNPLPDWLYVVHDDVPQCDIQVTEDGGTVKLSDKSGRTVFTATRHELQGGTATRLHQLAWTVTPTDAG